VQQLLLKDLHRISGSLHPLLSIGQRSFSSSQLQQQHAVLRQFGIHLQTCRNASPLLVQGGEGIGQESVNLVHVALVLWRCTGNSDLTRSGPFGLGFRPSQEGENGLPFVRQAVLKTPPMRVFPVLDQPERAAPDSSLLG
jgi:hypothetical protein